MGGPRVVHVVPAPFGRTGVVGGAERYALELGRAMAERVPTTLVTFGSEPREEAAGQLKVRVLGPAWHVRGQATNPFAPTLFAALRGVDVIHCHQQHVVASSAAALFGRLTRRPVFVTELGGGGWDVSSYFSTDGWYAGHLHVSAYSRSVAGHDGRPWARVILGGVDATRFTPGPAAPRPESDASAPTGRPVLFVGRILPHKGVDVLLRAAPADVAVEIVGPAPDARYLGDLHALAAGKRVLFRHDCDEDALVHAYRRAACVVLPSVYRTMYGAETRVPELLGQTLLEAAACATPAVATAVASLPEVVDDGVTGFLVPPNDPEALGGRLRWLREHPAAARALGDAGRARMLERFTWDAVVTRCLDAYATARRGT
jgi:glycosyltransferase involved in cell wall biosynthesis